MRALVGPGGGEFRRFWLATAISVLGTWMAAIALAIRMFDMTGSPGWVSALLFAEFTPVVLIGFLVGDRLNRLRVRRSLVICDIGSAAVFAGAGADLDAMGGGRPGRAGRRRGRRVPAAGHRRRADAGGRRRSRGRKRRAWLRRPHDDVSGRAGRRLPGRHRRRRPGAGPEQRLVPGLRDPDLQLRSAGRRRTPGPPPIGPRSAWPGGLRAPRWPASTARRCCCRSRSAGRSPPS